MANLGAKRDSNEAEIVAALRAAGCAVQLLRGNAAGVPDLLIYHPRRGLVLIEVKVQRGALSEAQTAWHQQFPVSVVRTTEEALAAAGLLTA
jgi:VRR-NUC domain